MSGFDDDAAFSCHGLDAVTMQAAAGELVGLWNTYDQETPFDHQMPNFVSQLGEFCVLECSTIEAIAACGLDATAKASALKSKVLTAADGTVYRIKEALRHDDGRTVELFVVPVSP